MKLDAHTAALLDEAVQALRQGSLVGMPTETVYGLAADAANPDAVRRIFALKGRPADHPLIVHVADASQLERWAHEIPQAARELATHFWPGPLTLILRKREDVDDTVTGGQDSIGLRCPAHPLALNLLQRFGGGLAAPSANRFGHVSPTSAQHVRDEFGAALPIVLDGGECEVGIESTIVDCRDATPRVLRPGMISAAQIEAVIGAVAVGATSHSPRASGLLDKHYAPRTPCRILEARELHAASRQALVSGSKLRVLAVHALPPDLPGIVLGDDPIIYAHGLYAALRALDAQAVDGIWIERPPAHAAWDAIHDRLRRAAAGSDDDAP